MSVLTVFLPCRFVVFGDECEIGGRSGGALPEVCTNSCQQSSVGYAWYCALLRLLGAYVGQIAPSAVGASPSIFEEADDAEAPVKKGCKC